MVRAHQATAVMTAAGSTEAAKASTRASPTSASYEGDVVYITSAIRFGLVGRSTGGISREVVNCSADQE